MKILTLIVALLLLCPFAFADEKESSIEKPKIVWVYSIITWYDKVPPFTNEFIHKSKSKCIARRDRINALYDQNKTDPLFGWIGECTRRELSNKLKGVDQ